MKEENKWIVAWLTRHYEQRIAYYATQEKAMEVYNEIVKDSLVVSVSKVTLYSENPF